MSKEEVAGALKDTYGDMTKEEALKLGAAIVAPGGLPLYAIHRLRKYKEKQEDLANDNKPSSNLPKKQNNKPR